jgi:hypothetical protein
MAVAFQRNAGILMLAVLALLAGLVILPGWQIRLRKRCATRGSPRLLERSEV